MSTTIDRPADLDLADLAVRVNGERFTHLTGRVVPYMEWGMRAGFDERIAPGAATASIARKPQLPLLRWHDAESEPIGIAEPSGWFNRPDGLWATFRIDTSNVAQEAARLAREGILGNMSIGYLPDHGHSDWEYHPQWNPNEGNVDRVTRHRIRLLEVSLVPVPMFEGAYVDHVEAVALSPSATPIRDGYVASIRALRAQYARAAYGR